MNFRFTRAKLFVSIIASVPWWYVVRLFSQATCLPAQCPDYQNIYRMMALFTIDPCTCWSLGQTLLRDVIILIPAILVYVIWSLFQRKKSS